MDIQQRSENDGEFSGWMRHNFEQLHTSTDFGSYGCSPPDAGFLANYEGANQRAQKTLADPEKVSVPAVIIKESSEGRPHLDGVQKHRTPRPVSLSHPLLESIKSVDPYSSPDCTPYATPESSPAPRRKISGASNETVSSNPEKWFYKGFFKADDPLSAKNLLQGKGRELKVKKEKNVLSSPEEDVAIPSGWSKKFTVSNFDINAVSPTSW